MHCAETRISVKRFHVILVAVVLSSDIVIISIIAIIILMIYHNMKFLLLPIPNIATSIVQYETQSIPV